MIDPKQDPRVHLALPKGRMQAGVEALLREAGVQISSGPRGYRPRLSLEGFETKLLKPQNIVEMLAAGSRDLGFAGADWVAEKDAELVELLDTTLDPVTLVAAAPPSLLDEAELADRPRVVASEYVELTRRWMEERGIQGHLLRTYGATEVFPPEDADVIVDNCASGATLAANGLVVCDELMRSSTRLYANPRALEEPTKRASIEGLVLGLRAVVAARGRVMVDLNVTGEDLTGVVDALPSMREPTVSSLHGQTGFAIRAAVPRAEVPLLIPRLKARGATDIVVTRCEQLVP